MTDNRPKLVVLHDDRTIHSIVVQEIVRWAFVYSYTTPTTTVHLRNGDVIALRGDYSERLLDAFKKTWGYRDEESQ